MAISRYWRLVGISTSSNGPLELSELRIYENGVLADAGATLSATFSPTSGTLDDLRDGSASGVVSWPYASYSSSGFALVWDFGVGGGVSTPSLQIGSGNSIDTYPIDLVMQISVDGLDWSTYLSPISDVMFPGELTLTSDTSSASDPYYANVSLLLSGNGADGQTTFIDGSANNLTPEAVGGNVKVSTATPKFGTGSIRMDGDGDYLQYASSALWDFAAVDATVEFHYRPTTTTNPGTFDALFARSESTTATNISHWAFIFGNGGVPTLYWRNGTGAELVTPVAVDMAVGTYYHLAFCKEGSTFRVYKNGMQITSGSANGITNTPTPLLIGALTSTMHFAEGQFDDFRITKGVCRYPSGAAFTPPNSAFLTRTIIPTNQLHPARNRQITRLPERLIPGVELPDTTAQGHAREHTFFDAYNGGICIITGTVKEKNTPSNTPLYRRVLLVDERSQMAIRETWSDAATGDYEFRGVKQGVKYTVISYDHLHNHRAVIADNQDAT